MSVGFLWSNTRRQEMIILGLGVLRSVVRRKYTSLRIGCALRLRMLCYLEGGVRDTAKLYYLRGSAEE
jgi:hypothetical protein